MESWGDQGDIDADLNQLSEMYSPGEGEIELHVEPDGAELEDNPTDPEDNMVLPIARPRATNNPDEMDAVHEEITTSLHKIGLNSSEEYFIKKCQEKPVSSAKPKIVPKNEPNVQIEKLPLEDSKKSSAGKKKSRNVAITSLAQIRSSADTAEIFRWAPVVEKPFSLEKGVYVMSLGQRIIHENEDLF